MPIGVRIGDHYGDDIPRNIVTGIQERVYIGQEIVTRGGDARFINLDIWSSGNPTVASAVQVILNELRAATASPVLPVAIRAEDV